MFPTNVRKSAAALVAFGAICLLAIGTVGFTQEKSRPKSSATTQVSPRTKAILAKLEEAIPMSFANETPLDDVLKYIKAATAGPDGRGIPVYVDPRGLHEARRSMASTITLDVEGSPLKATLPRILAQLDLAHIIKDDVLIISSRNGIDREQKELMVLAMDMSPKTKAVLAKLEQPIPMNFAFETPLDYVLKYIKRATTTATFSGIPIYLDPLGLKETHRSFDSTVAIDLEGVPLKTTLRLLLRQLDLSYIVKDGLLVIDSSNGIRKLHERAKNRPKRADSERK
jgi:hypothetical protein